MVQKKNSTTANSGLAKVAVQFSADSFVVNQSLVLRINICGENRHLRQAAKRYVQTNIAIVLTMNKPNRASTLWNKASKSLGNYQKYIEGKQTEFELTLVDLLYISNFKGGNASIHEDQEKIDHKLKEYSKVLKLIHEGFYSRSLVQLSDLEMKRLIELAKMFLNLKDNLDTAIDGFKASFLSTILHSHFPDLFPILDRRLLVNMDLVHKIDLSKSKQVRNIGEFYPKLIEKVRDICKASNKSIRKVDEEYFSIQF